MKKYKTLEYDKKYDLSQIINHLTYILSYSKEKNERRDFELFINFVKLYFNASVKYSVNEIIANYNTIIKQFIRKSRLKEIEKKSNL